VNTPVLIKGPLIVVLAKVDSVAVNFANSVSPSTVKEPLLETVVFP